MWLILLKTRLIHLLDSPGFHLPYFKSQLWGGGERNIHLDSQIFKKWLFPPSFFFLLIKVHLKEYIMKLQPSLAPFIQASTVS